MNEEPLEHDQINGLEVSNGDGDEEISHDEEEEAYQEEDDEETEHNAYISISISHHRISEQLKEQVCSQWLSFECNDERR